MHKSITTELITDMVEESLFGESSKGICVACGEVAHNIEPDAIGYKCETCGEQTVYGAEELINFIDDKVEG